MSELPSPPPAPGDTGGQAPPPRWVPRFSKPSRQVFPAVDQCIYCGSVEGLTDEHIIPYGLEGPWILQKASCNTCADVTKRIEQHILRDVFRDVRAILNLRTRRKTERPTTYVLSEMDEISGKLVEVPLEDHLAPFIMPVLHPPAYLEGRQDISPRGSFKGTYARLVGRKSVSEIGEKYGIEKITASLVLRLSYFARFLGKVGWGFAVARLGIDSWAEIYVVPAILGNSQDIFRWVGSAPDRIFAGVKSIHAAQVYRYNRDEITVRVALFPAYDAPEYLIVVGRVNELGARQLSEQPNP